MSTTGTETETSINPVNANHNFRGDQDERLQQIARRWERDGPTAVSPGEVSYLLGALRDARSENRSANAAIETERKERDRQTDRALRAETQLAAERATIRRVVAAFEEWEQNPGLYSPAFVARFLRAALVGEVSE